MMSCFNSQVLIRVAFIVSFSVGLGCPTAFAQESEVRRLKPIDVFELEFATDPQISPSGAQIAYVRNYYDIMHDRRRSQIWLIDGEGEQSPLLSNFPNASSPRWSPDGSRIAFVTIDDDGNSQIFCHWIRSNRTGALSRLTESPSELSWSPDGKWIGFAMRVMATKKPFVSPPKKPEGAEWADAPEIIEKLRYRSDGGGYESEGFDHLFVLHHEGGTPRQITDGDHDHGGTICWTPDSQAIIFSANRREDSDFQPRNSEIYEVDLKTLEIKQLTDRDGVDGAPAISKDGKSIGYVGFDDKMLGHQNANLYVMNRDGSNPRRVDNSLDRSISTPVWNESAQAFAYTYSDNGNSKLGQSKIDGSTTLLANNLGGNAAGRPYGSGGRFSISEGGVMAFVVNTPEHPGDVARRLPGGNIERLTHLNDDLLNNRTLGKVEEIRFPSNHDQREIQGWFITPPDFDPQKKYPLILEIHGGPFADYGDRFTAELQLYAASGYVVLYINPRGSTSYGQDFSNLIHHNYPGNDYDDLMSGVDAIIEKGFVNDKELFVTGGSGGGVLTAWIVGKTNRFRAAVVVKPVINWYSFALTADMYNYFYKYWFPGFPWDYPEEYMKRSPISLVGNVETPTMVMTGVVDYRTPISETEQFYQALKLRKIDTMMVRIPGASHGISARPSHLIAKVSHVLKWFEKYRDLPKEKE